MGGYSKLSEKEIEWTKEAIQRLEGKLGVKSITETGLEKEYKKKFGKKITPGGIYSRMLKYRQPGTKRGKSPNKLFENSSFVVYLKDLGVFGFDTEDEVKEFLIKSKIIGNVLVFKKVSVDIKFDIHIK